MTMSQHLDEDKVGENLKAQRFQMLEDIARELSSGNVVFPTCFDAALRLRKELQNPDLPIPRMVKVVALEPLVATRLMQMAGSVLYSPDGTPARDLQAAKLAAERIGDSIRIVEESLRAGFTQPPLVWQRITAGDAL